MNMRRSGLLVLTVLVLSAALLHAQRAGGGSQGEGSHGGGVAGAGGHAGGRMPGHGTRPGSSNGFFPLRSGGHHNRGYGAVWFPYGAPYWVEDGNFWDEPSDQQPPQQPAPPQVVVVQDRAPRQPAAPPRHRADCSPRPHRRIRKLLSLNPQVFPSQHHSC